MTRSLPPSLLSFSPFLPSLALTLNEVQGTRQVLPYVCMCEGVWFPAPIHSRPSFLIQVVMPKDIRLPSLSEAPMKSGCLDVNAAQSRWSQTIIHRRCVLSQPQANRYAGWAGGLQSGPDASFPCLCSGLPFYGTQHVAGASCEPASLPFLFPQRWNPPLPSGQ